MNLSTCTSVTLIALAAIFLPVDPPEKKADRRTTPSAAKVHGIAMPSRMAVMAAPLDGILAEIAIKEGQTVAVGDLLARMDDRVARTSVRAAEAAALRTAAIAHAEQEVALSQAMLARIRPANAAGATTDAAVDEAVARLEQARATLASAKEQKIQFERNLELERAKLHQHTIHAPFPGIVTKVQAEVGVSVHSAHELLVLANLTTLKAELNLPVAGFNEIEVGKSYRMQAGAPVNAEIQGRLKSIDPIIDAASRTFRCVFEIENAQGLPAGFTVQLLDFGPF